MIRILSIPLAVIGLAVAVSPLVMETVSGWDKLLTGILLAVFGGLVWVDGELGKGKRGV